MQRAPCSSSPEHVHACISLPLLDIVLALLEQPGRFRQYSNVKLLLLTPSVYIIKFSILSHEVDCAEAWRSITYNRSAVMKDCQFRPMPGSWKFCITHLLPHHLTLLIRSTVAAAAGDNDLYGTLMIHPQLRFVFNWIILSTSTNGCWHLSSPLLR